MSADFMSRLEALEHLVASITSNSGAFSALQLGGDITTNQTEFTIKKNTADGADNGRILLAGGGAVSVDRGGHAAFIGNEYATDGGSCYLIAGNISTGEIVLFTGNGVRRAKITNVGSVVLNASGAALATNATGGFTYIPTCPGTPTGVPTAYTGSVPLVYDTDNNRLYAYNGAWRMILLS